MVGQVWVMEGKDGVKIHWFDSCTPGTPRGAPSGRASLLTLVISIAFMPLWA